VKIVRVLVVEDEPRMSMLLQRGFREEGYAVDAAADGTDGLWLAMEQDYDAIVLDIMIPELDGIEVCRRLRASSRWAPVLLLTARDGVDDRVRGLDIECFGRDLEARGRARATIARRLCTIAGFYRYAEEEGLVAHSPAMHVRRPRLDYESHVTGLDRNELGALLVAAGLSSARDHALVSLLALNGLRVSEALGADIDALGLERGHRTLTVTRKGGKTSM